MKLLKNVILTLLACLVILPFLFTILNAFMGSEEFFYYYGSLQTGEKVYLAFHLLPDRWSAEGFVTILLSAPDYLLKFWNSMGITAAIAAGQVTVSCLAGYGFSKFRFPGHYPLFVLVVLLMMMPYQVTLVSNYIILNRLKLLGGYGAVILPGIFSSFGVFLMKQVMDGIPKEILEAARLDGAGHFRILLEMALPIVKGGVGSLLILNFVDNWNMVEQPLVFLKEKSMYPLSVFLADSIAASGMEIFACGVLAMLPVVLLFAGLRDELENGISLSGLK